MALLLFAAILWGTLTLSGCARIHVECPADGAEHVIIGGNNSGTVALAALSALAQAAAPALLARPEKSRTSSSAPAARTTVDYTYMPIFGSDLVICGSGEIPGG